MLKSLVADNRGKPRFHVDHPKESISMSDDLRYIPTAADLFAAATVIEKRCSEQNIAFMECKTKCEHPKECLAQAHTVQECVMDT